MDLKSFDDQQPDSLEGISYPFYSSEPLVGGGTIYLNGFFVQSIFADRYNHRRELWVVSSESPSSVKISQNSDFFRQKWDQYVF